MATSSQPTTRARARPIAQGSALAPTIFFLLKAALTTTITTTSYGFIFPDCYIDDRAWIDPTGWTPPTPEEISSLD
jgi:hypothetical protein